MWMRRRFNSMSDREVSPGQDSAVPLDHRLSSLFLRMGERGAAHRPLLPLRPILLLFTLSALAGGASSATTPLARQLPIAPSFCDEGCAIADLDGDGRPDLAVAKLAGWAPSGFRYRIDLDLTSRAGRSSFSVFAQRGGLRIIPRDVNGDWELDLIITSARSFTPIGVWINDGHGGFVRSDPAFDFQPVWGKGPRLLSDPSGEAFQATVPEFSRNWPHDSKGPSLHKETLTQYLTLQLRDVRLPTGSPRRSPTRGPPPRFWQPVSTANAQTA
jgi:hypothetical protein